MARLKPVTDQLPNRELKVSDLAVRDLTLSRLELAPRAVLQLRFVDESLNRAYSPFVAMHVI